MSKIASPALSLLLASTLLAGCGDDGTITPPATPLAGVAVHGAVTAGTTAVSGAHVYLFVAGIGGYATASTSLLQSGQSGVTLDATGNGYVTTGTNGSFTLGGDYTCPSSSSLVYLLSVGGNPGAAAGSNNTAITFAAALGTCGSLTGNTSVALGEESTIATAYALAAFASSATKIASGTNTTGIQNAFNMVPVLINFSTGFSNPFTSGNVGSIPQFTFNSLANLLNTCSSTSASTSSGCAALMAAATPSGGTAPADTFQAILNIAQHPGNQVATLYTLSRNSVVFGGTPGSGILAAQPNDWTLSIRYSATSIAGLVLPQQISMDAQGNAWIVNSGSNALVEISPLGAPVSPLTGPGGYSGPINAAVFSAIDQTGNVWTVDLNDNLGKFSSTGTVLYNTSILNAASLSAVAIDPTGNVWMASKYNSNNLFEYNSSGTLLSPAMGYTTPCLQYTNAAVIDPAGNIWMAGQNTSCLAKFSSAGSVLSGNTGFTGGGMGQNTYGALAVDHSGNIWVASGNGALSTNQVGVVSEFTSAGTPITTSTGYTSGGIFNPSGIAIDGVGNVWVTNVDSFNPPSTTTHSRISVISSTGAGISPSDGYLQNAIGPVPLEPAIDGSGNVWVADNSNNQVFQILGAAAPVVTPLSAAVKNNLLGTRP